MEKFVILIFYNLMINIIKFRQIVKLILKNIKYNIQIYGIIFALIVYTIYREKLTGMIDV